MVLGANVNNQDKSNETPVMYCAQRGRMDILKILLQYNPNLALRNNENKTAAEIARSNGHVAIEKLLLEKSRNF